MSGKKPALKTIDLDSLDESTKAALQNLENFHKLEQETIIQANLQKLLTTNKSLQQLNLEEQQLLKLQQDGLIGLNHKQRNRLTNSLPNQRQTLIKSQRPKAAKLSSYELFQLNRHYQKQRQQLLLKGRQEQKQQQAAFGDYLRRLFVNPQH